MPTMNAAKRKDLTPAEAAVVAGVTRSTIWRWRKAGRLPGAYETAGGHLEDPTRSAREGAQEGGMMAPTDYGKYYWCAKVSTDLSKDGEIYVYADDVRVDGAGALTFTRTKDSNSEPTLTIAPGKWLAYFAASVLDGAAVAVEHWSSEVAR